MVDKESQEDFQERINFTATNILFGSCVISAILPALFGLWGMVTALVVLVLVYIGVIRILNAKPWKVAEILMYVVFAAMLVVLIFNVTLRILN